MEWEAIRIEWIQGNMGVLAAVLTLLVGLFRVAVGMHYPTDVLAGWALGFAALGALLIRTVRYAVIIFVIMGIYPKLFPHFETLGKRRSAA